MKQLNGMNKEQAINYFGQSWAEQLNIIYTKYMDSLGSMIKKNPNIIPQLNEGTLFRAFRECPYNRVKVVILAQDPYHTPGVFDGLAFSNKYNKKPQPSLKNIFEEINRDVYNNLYREVDLDLTYWAHQGVLLLNVAHSVLPKKPRVHLNRWREFSNHVVEALNKRDDIIWLLWGKFAQNYSKAIVNKSHNILEAAHPSPLSADNGFFGCQHFSQTNTLLKKKGKKVIVW